ncbi:MAG: 4-alpha-glucanotransferase, partial [Candidatus Omnitrophica bacterium]|nr:4-alpha-glucanotransferase [Candidatus Omnitrophota bacterium]
MDKRASGILLHITSLPSLFGIGDFGPSAYGFVDFLSQTKQSYWQILPLGPTDTIYYNSPYYGISAFACNLLLISPEQLVDDGLLEDKDIKPDVPFSGGKVDYQAVTGYKAKLIHKAYSRFIKRKGDAGYDKFCLENSDWLEDYALFTALKSHFKGQLWSEWSPDLRDRRDSALKAWGEKLKDEVNREKITQYLLIKQWVLLKRYSNQKGIRIIGDMPIYIDYNSADAWVNPHIFKLDNKKRPYAVAGVPPDYFSKTGQLWGNPVYNWQALKKTNYQWWSKRMKYALSIYDIVRIDHFRGLVAYWEIPSREKTAINGKWVKVPVVGFINTLRKEIKDLPVIAEDLGIITDDVKKVMKRYSFPGMKVLLFAFDGDPAKNPYMPDNHVENCILYTGTHDNNTVRGWYEHDAKEEEKKNLLDYLGRGISLEELSWEFIRIAMNSIANTSIIPMQDILSLGQEARMNRPSVAQGNWQW